MTAGHSATTQYSILVIDDDPQLCRALQSLLQRSGFRVSTCVDAHEAIRLIGTERFDLAIVDYMFPGEMHGHQLIRELRRISPTTSFAAMTAYSTAEVANRMLGQGAAAYFQKPIQDPGRFRRQIRDLLEKRETEGLATVVDDQQLIDHPAFRDLLGTSPAMLRLKREILYFAPYETNVLILGESGSGKGVVANAIHRASARVDGPFRSYNISAMPDGLVESLLFGNEKGAFQGAHARKLGLFEAASGGTVFLDEIGDLPIDQQVKLLKVVENKEVWRLGATSATPIDTRIVAATHVDLKRASEEGRFRKDLLYRLNNVRLQIPPLRDRLEDVPLLAWRAIKTSNASFGKGIDKVAPQAIDFLQAYPWGENNVRELQIVIERVMMRVDNDARELTVEDLQAAAPDVTGPPRAGSATANPRTPSPATAAAPPRSAASAELSLDPALLEMRWSEARKAFAEWFKREYVRQALVRNDNNITQAAKDARVDRSNFHRMMRDTGIELQHKRFQKLQRRTRDESDDT